MPPDLAAVSSPTPEDLGGAARAFGHRLELGPADRFVADACAETAIGAGQHILPPDQPGIAYEALGDEVGVLDEIGAVADDPRDERRALGQFHLLEDAPFV